MDPSHAPLPLSLFDYPLPEALIAHRPLPDRDASRMMVLAANADPEHRRFIDLPDLLREGDLLVLNTTRVLKARVYGVLDTGGRVELLFCRPVEGEIATATCWWALAMPARKLYEGRLLHVEGFGPLRVVKRQDDEIAIEADKPILELLQSHGTLPLPPYIHRDTVADAADDERYQTVFANTEGAVAAPTASLHFTEAMLAELRARGVQTASLVLHVGPGTFLPVRKDCADDIRAHHMHAEFYEIPAETWEAVQRTRAAGGRVIAVGTTVMRALESAAKSGETQGASRLFIYPGFTFEMVDAMITNFHLPKSTLLMLVAAFAGRDRIMAAYQEAFENQYRFFSYGDAMWVEKHHAI